MRSPQQLRASQVAVLTALLAMCLRLAMPLLHGGHGCDHQLCAATGSIALEACACGVVHTPTGDLPPNGDHQDGEPAPTEPCLACQLEDQSPGGAPLHVVVVIARPHAPPPAAARAPGLAPPSSCVLPSPRAPPIETV